MKELPFNPLDAGCPSREILSRIGDRWTVLIVTSLAEGPLRFAELSRRVEGISPKMLTQSLKALTADGIVVRTVYAESPPRVEYELSASGYSLLEPLAMLVKWSVDHAAGVIEYRGTGPGRRSFSTPIGTLTLEGTSAGVRRVLFDDEDAHDRLPVLVQAQEEIEQYFAGERTEFTVELDRAEPSNFKTEVQRHLASISFGQTVTYGEIAEQLGRPRAARAVGTACASNPLPILVPCHRVLASKGLGGYLGGLPAKQYLLELEGIHLHP